MKMTALVKARRDLDHGKVAAALECLFIQSQHLTSRLLSAQIFHHHRYTHTQNNSNSCIVYFSAALDAL